MGLNIDVIFSVSAIDWNSIVDVIPVGNSLEELVVQPHVEEVIVLSASEWVIFILSNVHVSSLWGLDVPEVMVWDWFQDLLLGGSSQTSVVGGLQIFGEVVLTIFEDTELYSNNFFPFFDIISKLLGLDLIHHLNLS